MPRVGLGTWPLVGAEAARAVAAAIEAGYRLIDTSEQYGNEEAVGEGIRASGVAREDVFVTTKFNARWHGVDLVRQAFEASARRLGTEYVDLLLIHWPNPWQDRYVRAFEGLIRLREAGHVRAIGVSNFPPELIERLIRETGAVPEVNQVELDPTLPRNEWRRYHEAHGIVTEAWSPLGRGGELLEHPVLRDIAAGHGKSPAQVVLRWHLELGGAFAARSSNPRRIAENIDVFDFGLSMAEMAALEALDEGRPPARDPYEHGH
jgi:2,5-diketo-D-gluconate reductase A